MKYVHWPDFFRLTGWAAFLTTLVAPPRSLGWCSLVCVHASLHHQVVNQLRAGDLCPSHLSNPWYTSCGLCKYPVLIWWDDQGKGMSELYKTAVDITRRSMCLGCLPPRWVLISRFLSDSKYGLKASNNAKMGPLTPTKSEAALSQDPQVILMNMSAWGTQP